MNIPCHNDLMKILSQIQQREKQLGYYRFCSRWRIADTNGNWRQETNKPLNEQIYVNLMCVFDLTMVSASRLNDSKAEWVVMHPENRYFRFINEREWLVSWVEKETVDSITYHGSLLQWMKLHTDDRLPRELILIGSGNVIKDVELYGVCEIRNN